MTRHISNDTEQKVLAGLRRLPSVFLFSAKAFRAACNFAIVLINIVLATSSSLEAPYQPRTWSVIIDYEIDIPNANKRKQH